MAVPTVGAGDTALRKAVTDKWEGASRTGPEAATPRPLGGEDEGGGEDTPQTILEDPV